MTSHPRKLFEFLLRLEIGDAVVEFDKVSREFCVRILAMDDESAIRKVAVEGVRWWNYVLKANDELLKSGCQPVFKVVDHDYRLINAFLQRDRKYNLSYRWAVLRWIDTLDDRYYEYLGALAPHLAGAKFNIVTAKGNEAGIDFISSAQVFGPLRAVHNNRECIRIVGQAKKYSDRVSVARLREFATTLNHVRTRAEDTRKHLPIWFQQLNGPIVGWVVGHNGFQTGAIEMAQNEGILLSDSIVLAEELLEKRSTRFNLSPQKTIEKLEEYLISLKEVS